MISKRIIYFDCFSGISGDMVLGALVNMGIDIKEIQNQLNSLNLKGYKLNSRQVKRNGLVSTKVNVALNQTSQKSHRARSFKDIKHLIEKSDLSKIVKFNSISIFKRIAKVEAKVHGTTINKIHFHEVGAIDSIIDIVGGSLAVNLLDADLIISSPINTGEGVVKCGHGILPVPAPATLELLKGIPCYSSGVEKELTTPTGAAFIGHFAGEFGSLPNMDVLSTGYGAGTHEIKNTPNLLRVVLGKSEELYHHRSMKVIETNIDDMNPEFYDYVIDQLFKVGAVDVFFAPINMKKNRPGILLSVITSTEYFDSVVRVILEETSTLGVRHYDVGRVALPRKQKIIMTPFGKVRVKIGGLNESTRSISPEYEDCRKIALKKEIPIKRIYDEALKAAWMLKM